MLSKKLIIMTLALIILLPIPAQATSLSQSQISKQQIEGILDKENREENLKQAKKMQRIDNKYQKQQERTQRVRIKEFEAKHPHTKVKIVQPKRPKLSKKEINKDLKQMRLQTFKDINREREKHHIKPLKKNHKLNKLANLRAKQIRYHFSHYSDSGEAITSIDAKKVHLPIRFQSSENIASTSLGRCSSIGNPKVYNNHNGKQMANMDNDSMMNYDQLEQNGHRKNILSRGNTLIGLGVSYNPKKHMFFLAEDFGSHNPQSSEDVKQPTQQSIKKHIANKNKKHAENYFQHAFHSIAKFFSYLISKIKELI